MENIEISNVLKAKLRLQAVDMGVEEKWLAEEAIRMIADMPRGLLGRLLTLHEGLGDCPFRVVVWNLLISEWARLTARASTGLYKDAPELLYHFAKVTSGGESEYVTGPELLKVLTEHYDTEAIQTLTGLLLYKQSRGSLSAEEQAFLDKHTEPMDEATAEVRRLIDEGIRTGKEIQIGESECCRCHSELTRVFDLRVQAPGKPPIIFRMCEPCAKAFDLSAGIHGLVRGKAGEEKNVMKERA